RRFPPRRRHRRRDPRGPLLECVPRLLRHAPGGRGQPVVTAEPFPYERSLATPAGRAKELVRTLLSWSAAPFGTLLRVATREPAVALTFDDGPDPAATQ